MKTEQQGKQPVKKKIKPSAPLNRICMDCYRWSLFKEKCYFYWEGKKFCPSKVRSEEELVMLERMRARL